jgi:hypothetical protein
MFAEPIPPKRLAEAAGLDVDLVRRMIRKPVKARVRVGKVPVISSEDAERIVEAICAGTRGSACPAPTPLAILQ